MFDRIDELGIVGLFPDGLTMGDTGWKKSVTSFNDIDSHNSEGPDGATCTSNAYDYDVFDNCPPEESQDACNWGTACSDDEGLLRTLIQKATNEWFVDPKRIYLTGFSQGGQTTQAMAWRLSDLLAAAAPQHGFATNGYTEAPSTPMGLFQVWANQDRTVDGNDQPSNDGMIYDGADETMTIWAEGQDCDSNTTPYPTDDDGNTGWGCIEHANCNTGAQVVSCVWDGRHTWGNRDGSNFALENMLDFFAKHARP
jgi:poly(3-hydroxybutyrate) depolymerase